VRFHVPRVPFIRLLRVVCHPAHALLRIEALPGSVSLACGDTEAGCEASVGQPGVCFLRHSKLKKLLQTYHLDAKQSATIEIEVTPHGIRVGRTSISRDGWEISLFANPDAAPRTLHFKSKEDHEDDPWADSQLLLPLMTPRAEKPIPSVPPSLPPTPDRSQRQ
jgi:hypothetical protein